MGLVVKYHFRLFPRNNDEIFQKIQKTLFWAPFAQIWAQMNFPGKSAVSF